MGSKGFQTVRGRRIRATRLDSCGRPVFGANSQAVSKGFATITYTTNTTTTDAIDVKNADGSQSIFEPSNPVYTGHTVNMTFNEVDPELFNIITGQSLYKNATNDSIGIVIGTDIDLTTFGFALELWSGVPQEGACLDPSVGNLLGYFLAPFLKGGVVGDIEVSNGAVSFTITGATTRNGTFWGAGPYRVQDVASVPSLLSTPLTAKKHLLLIWVSVPAPDAVYGARPVMDPTKTNITAVTIAKGGNAQTAVATFTGGASGVPVWIDWGDGTWDYQANGNTTATHIYVGSGAFTVKATANGVFVQTTINVPLP